MVEVNGSSDRPSVSADAILGRVSVALAKHQRLVASWLPKRTAEEVEAAKAENVAERRAREDAIFVPEPEILGLGAKVPSTTTLGSHSEPSADKDAKLRKLVAPKSILKSSTPTTKVVKLDGVQTSFMPTKPEPVQNHTSGLPAGENGAQAPKDVSDDEGGRSTIGKADRHGKKKSKHKESNGSSHSHVSKLADSERSRPSAEAHEVQVESKSKKRPASILDELLSAKSKKKKKKRNKKRELESEPQ